MLLILPVFLTIVFSIMELGNIAFWVIVLNHATFECARIGAMLYSDNAAVDGKMQQVMSKIIASATVASTTEPTVKDNQAMQMNHDLIVTGQYNVHLVFPISSILLAEPKGSGLRQISAVVRMPIEQPLTQ